MSAVGAALRSGGVTVISLGNIVPDDVRYGKKIAEHVHVYPVGYEVKRSVSAKAPAKGGDVDCTFSIRKGENGPVFVITPSDEPGVVYEAPSVQGAWKQFTSSRGSNASATTGGMLKFGLAVDAVADAIKQLPGYAKLISLLIHDKGSSSSQTDPLALPDKQKRVPAARGKKVEAPAEVQLLNKDASVVDAADENDKKKTMRKGARSAKPLPSAAPVCDMCGLSAPFCATSGQPHVFAMTPCPVCRLQSVFCSQTGERHGPLHQPVLVTVQEEPVKAAPAAPKKPRSTAKSAEGNEGPVSKKRRGESLPVSSTPELVAVQDTATVPSEADPLDSKPRRASKKQLTLTSLPMKPVGDLGLAAAAPPPPFQYPPLKPLLSKAEQHTFRQILTAGTMFHDKMEAAGITSAVAQKKYVSFMLSYYSEKGKLDAIQHAKQADAKKAQAGDAIVIVDSAGSETPNGDAV